MTTKHTNAQTEPNIWDAMNPADIPTGRRYRYRATPAQCRDLARAYIQKFDGMDRDREAFQFLADAVTSRRLYFTNAQLAGMAEGLRLGRMEGTL